MADSADIPVSAKPAEAEARPIEGRLAHLISERSTPTFVSNFDFKFGLILVLYSGLGLLLVDRYQYQISPDSISYISLAQKYLAGDFANAVNGIWAPLYSWLLIPFLFLGVDPLLASVILTVVFGAVGIVLCRSIMQKVELPPNVAFTILLTLVPVTLSFALADSPSDFLVVVFLLGYFNRVVDPGFANKTAHGLEAGAWAAFAYYSKAFALPFFFAHFFCWSAISYLKKRADRRRVLRNFLLGTASFLALTLSWIALISFKYDRLTFSTAGKFNYLAAGPESKSKGGPYYYSGLFSPPNETAPNGWEDPTHHEMPHWSPFDSKESLKHAAKLIVNNAKLTFRKFAGFSALTHFILLASVLACLWPKLPIANKDFIWFCCLSLAIYCLGYVLIVVETRYLWIAAILIIMLGGYLLKLAFWKRSSRRFERAFILVIFAASFIWPSARWLIANLDTKRDVYVLSQELREEHGIRGNIATNKHHTTLYLAYHLGAKYFGQVRLNSTAAELAKTLTEHNIDYFFVWGEALSYQNFLTQFREVTSGSVAGLRVFSLRDRN